MYAEKPKTTLASGCRRLFETRSTLLQWRRTVDSAFYADVYADYPDLRIFACRRIIERACMARVQEPLVHERDERETW